MTILRTEQVSIMRGRRRLLHDFSWQARSGEFWCVLGRNGAGKTSLLQVLAGLLAPVTGRVLIDETALTAIALPPLARLRGLLPQQQVDAFALSVLDTVLIGRAPYRVGRGWDTEDDLAAAQAALAAVGMDDRVDSDVLQLSGGERQRVGLATLLLQNPAMMLLDEPTAHQDVAHQLVLLRLIRRLSEKQLVIMNCHDINLAARFATHVLLLNNAEAVAGPAQTVLTPERLQAAYGCLFTRTVCDGVPTFIAS